MPTSSDGDTPPTTPPIGTGVSMGAAEGTPSSTPASGTGTPSSPSAGARGESMLPPALHDTQSMADCEQADMSSRVFNTRHMVTSTLELKVSSVTMTQDRAGSFLNPRRRKKRPKQLRKMLRQIRQNLGQGEDQ